MPRTGTRRTGHQALVAKVLTRFGHFYWADFKGIMPVDTAFKDAVYKAVERLRKRHWVIHQVVGGYWLVEEGD